MIDKVNEFLDEALRDTDYFPVDVVISPDNDIQIEIDSFEPVDIDFCTELSRKFEEAFSRDEEDYSLEIGSAGLTSPFKVKKQFDKNIGNMVEVDTADGKRMRGTLISAGEDSFAISTVKKVKPEGKKRPVEVAEEVTIPYTDAKSVCYYFEF